MIKSSTVLATIELGNRLYFAADRRISWDMSKAAISPTPKVAKRNGILLSGTGYASICFEVIHRSTFPIYKGQDPDNYVHNEFLPAIISDLRTVGIVDKDERRLASPAKSDYRPSAVILIGIKSDNVTAVYELDMTSDSISIDRVPTTYAHGCGGDYAMAILSFLTQPNFEFAVPYKKIKGKDRHYKMLRNYEVLKLGEEDVLRTAIMAAAQHSPGCDDNTDILFLE
jgi:hypothetical protein